MKVRTTLVLTLGALATALVIDNTINGAYESAINFIEKHPRLKNNRVGMALENALIDGYLTRNLPIEGTDYVPQSRPFITMVADRTDPSSMYKV